MSENGFAESSRSGPLRAGERIQLTDAKGKLHTITLTAGATWQGHKGHISHDQIIGSSEMYESVSARENGIESVKKNAPDAAVDDQTV